MILIGVTLAAIAAMGLIPMMIDNKPAPRPQPVPVATPQPVPTPVPTPTPAPAVAVATTPTPQPPGPVPEGKVWSPEHGHWHDAVPAADPNSPIKVEAGPGIVATATPVAAPEAVPSGKALMSLGTVNTPDGTSGHPNIPQPPGPVPPNSVWSPEHGHWHKKN